MVPKVKFKRLLTLAKTKSPPNIDVSVYYPRWEKTMNGLKSVAAESTAGNINEKLKRGGARLDLVGYPLIDGKVAGVLMKRTGSRRNEFFFEFSIKWLRIPFPPLRFGAPSIFPAPSMFDCLTKINTFTGHCGGHAKRPEIPTRKQKECKGCAS